MRFRPRFSGLAASALILLEGVVVFLMLWQPVMERRIPRNLIQSDGLYLYTVDTARLPGLWGYRWVGNSTIAPRQSTLALLEDGVPLGPADTPLDLIRPYGKGSFNHWGRIVYFSSRDNSDPRSGARVYVAAGPAVARGTFLGVLIGISAVLGILLVWLGAPAVRERLGAAAVADSGDDSAPRTIGGVIAALKIAALILIGILGPLLWLPLIRTEATTIGLSGRTGFLALYLLVVAVSVVGLVIAPFLRGGWIRISICAVLIAGFCIDQIMRSISGQPMTLDMMNTLWRERAMDTVLLSYMSAIWPNVLLAAVLAAVLFLPPIGRWSVSGRFAIVPVAALAAVGLMLVATNGRSEQYPSPYAVPAEAVAQLFFDRGDAAERRPVEYDSPLRSEFKKIVVVIDESVRGDYLGLNNAKYDNTPVLNAASDKIANYGVAISGANCSASSRMMMRVGLQQKQLPDVQRLYRRLPTLWQYAHAARYKSVLIDAFHPFVGYHSYMDAKEAAQIDEFRPTSAAGPAYNQDVQVARMLLDTLARDEKSLIYVNKAGAHNPYATRYPPDLGYDPAPLVSALPLDNEQRESVVSYHRAIRWAVDGFFQTILPHLGDDTLLIYTSDHGQSLYEGGYAQSHCTARHDLAPGEVYVPLFVIAGSAVARQHFEAEAKRAYNHASHFEIFSTIVESMGYSKDWVERQYGPGLLNVPVERSRGFLLGTLFLSGSTWVDVDHSHRDPSIASH